MRPAVRHGPSPDRVWLPQPEPVTAVVLRMHLHLDALGGVAGDMFAAALLDLAPEHGDRVAEQAAAVAGVRCQLLPHSDGTLTGRRFVVHGDAHHPHQDHSHRHDHGDHMHARWRDIRDRLHASALTSAARGHAIGIFALLAEAEARVHGVDAEQVTFHEVGAADSIADIVAAGVLIEALCVTSCSVSALPLGGGRVITAHGPMPVPAPAVALLVEGFATLDDGIPGERVTPTGAAILRYLRAHEGRRPAGRIAGSGTGFGTRKLAGITNCLRALAIETGGAFAAHRELLVVSFEVDDQSPEDLAIGLDRVRAVDGVHDVLQMPVFGKKGRIAAHVRVLVRPDAGDAAIEACFRETTTIGLRTHLVQGLALPRRIETVPAGGRTVRVKRVERPGGPTAKAEADDLRDIATHAARVGVRRAAEEG